MFGDATVRSTVAVIGGGFYGCWLAARLAAEGLRVILIEREQDLLQRASYHNQGRLHGGLHYPRDFATGWRSRFNSIRFYHEFRPAVYASFRKIYAIARHGSKTSPAQMLRFAESIEAPIRPVDPATARLFNPALIAAAHETQEYAFDAGVLRRLLTERVQQAGVTLRLGQRVEHVRRSATASGCLSLDLTGGSSLDAALVLNCTYSGAGSIAGAGALRHLLKHEWVEMPLVTLPEPLRDLSVTVMDGPFFSWMPFPDRGLWTLSHVRYTPRGYWIETPPEGEGTAPDDPYRLLTGGDRSSRFAHMVRDVARYIPAAMGMEHKDSLFEIKTVLASAERHDQRRILVEESRTLPGFVTILGSKLDNVYDAWTAIAPILARRLAAYAD